jgi:hypothetical protein
MLKMKLRHVSLKSRTDILLSLFPLCLTLWDRIVVCRMTRKNPNLSLSLFL